jgi:hypothetical protein
METITVTPAEIIYHRRLAVLEHAARCGNVSEACRTFDVSRTRYYEWKKLLDHMGRGGVGLERGPAGLGQQRLRPVAVRQVDGDRFAAGLDVALAFGHVQVWATVWLGDRPGRVSPSWRRSAGG